MNVCKMTLLTLADVHVLQLVQGWHFLFSGELSSYLSSYNKLVVLFYILQYFS